MPSARLRLGSATLHATKPWIKLPPFSLREGFPRGTTVFLDVEYMDFTPKPMREYYSAWVRTVLADGRYRPGIYVHTNNANIVYDDVKREYLAAGLADEPPFWVA